MFKVYSLFVTCFVLSVSVLQAQSGLCVLTSDFSTGNLAFLDAEVAAAEVNLLNIHADAVGHYHEGRVYVINRLGQDNILVLDGQDLSTPITQFSVGNGSNPHDIEIVAPDKAYITRYETAELLIVNPQDGSERGRLDLSAFADGDGLPEVSQIVRLGDRLYLSSQRLERNNGWVAEQSYLIVVDLLTDTLVDTDPQREGIQGIALSAPNPNSIVAVGKQIIVGLAAGFGDREGGIDVIDSSTNNSLGLAISEADLGGDINMLAMVNEVQGYAVISDENFVNSVHSINLETGVVGPALGRLSGGYIPSIAIDGTRLLVADRGSFDAPEDAGVKVFDVATGDFLAGPINTGLPPAFLVVLSDMALVTAVAANDENLPQRMALDPAYPNPFNATVQIPLSIASATRAEVSVVDVLGRQIRTLASGYLSSGRHILRWDGRDAQGRLVGNGTYFVRLQQQEKHTISKVMLLK